MAMMGYREYARHRVVTLRAVQKAIEAGRIHVTTDELGKRWIDSERADRDWLANTDPAAQSLLYSAGPLPPATQLPLAEPPAAADDDEPVADSAATPEYRQARAAREEIRRDREQLELDRLRGSLIPLADAQQAVYTAFRTLRDAVLHVPARAAHQCATRTDPFEIEQLLEAELNAAFLRFDPAKMLAADDDDGDDDDAG